MRHTPTVWHCAWGDLCVWCFQSGPLKRRLHRKSEPRFIGWTQVKVADADLLTDWQRKNKEYKQRHQLNAHRESDTMARLMKFRQHLQAPKPESNVQPDSSCPTAGACAICSLVLYDIALVLCSCFCHVLAWRC